MLINNQVEIDIETDDIGIIYRNYRG